MHYLLLASAAIGLVSFAWARHRFFVRSASTPPLRNGLGPMGTVFGLALVAQLALANEVGGEARTVVALMLFVISIALFWLSVRAFGSTRPLIAFSPGTPNRLITNGPYQFIRHPLYTAYSVFWLAGALAVPNWLTVVAVAVMPLMYYRAAKAEEESLAQSDLGPLYSKYCQSTGMFFPKRRHRR